MLRDVNIDETTMIIVLLLIVIGLTVMTAVTRYRTRKREHYGKLIHNICDYQTPLETIIPTIADKQLIAKCIVQTSTRSDGKLIIAVVGPYALDVKLWVCDTVESAKLTEQQMATKLNRWLAEPVAEVGVVSVTKLGGKDV